MVPKPGLEPRLRDSKSPVLPLHHLGLVDGEGFEPPNNKELVYSQPRLATSLPIPSSLGRIRTYNLAINFFNLLAPPLGFEPRFYKLTVCCIAIMLGRKDYFVGTLLLHFFYFHTNLTACYN